MKANWPDRKKIGEASFMQNEKVKERYGEGNPSEQDLSGAP